MQRPRQTAHHRVLPLVEGVGRDRAREVLGGVAVGGVHHAHLGGAGDPAALDDRVEVLLLADVDRDRVHLVSLLGEPADRDRRVESAAVGEHCALHDASMIWVSDRSSRCGRNALAAEDEDRVVAGDRAGDVGEPDAVDALGEGRRRAGRGPDHQPALGADERQRELVEQMAEQAQRRRGVRLAGDDVAHAVVAVHAREPELLDVAADRRLRRLEAHAREARADVLLRAEPLAGDERQDRVLALRLDGAVHAGHGVQPVGVGDGAERGGEGLHGDVDLLGRRRSGPATSGRRRRRPRWPALPRRSSRERPRGPAGARAARPAAARGRGPR